MWEARKVINEQVTRRKLDNGNLVERSGLLDGTVVHLHNLEYLVSCDRPTRCRHRC